MSERKESKVRVKYRKEKEKKRSEILNFKLRKGIKNSSQEDLDEKNKNKKRKIKENKNNIFEEENLKDDDYGNRTTW